MELAHLLNRQLLVRRNLDLDNHYRQEAAGIVVVGTAAGTVVVGHIVVGKEVAHNMQIDIQEGELRIEEGEHRI